MIHGHAGRQWVAALGDPVSQCQTAAAADGRVGGKRTFCVGGSWRLLGLFFCFGHQLGCVGQLALGVGQIRQGFPDGGLKTLVLFTCVRRARCRGRGCLGLSQDKLCGEMIAPRLEQGLFSLGAIGRQSSRPPGFRVTLPNAGVFQLVDAERC